MFRRDFLRSGASGAFASLLPEPTAHAAATNIPPGPPASIFNVRDFGAAGDGATIDSPAINRAVQAAADAGGGTVLLPAGTYACYTIRLRSNIALKLDPGATIIAAQPRGGAGYDPAGQPQAWESFQDFGHSHWANSLVVGEDLHDVSIYGPGTFDGTALSRGEPDEFPRAETPGVGNKTIALEGCRNVVLRDFNVRMGGHFAVLLTGTDNVVVDGLTIDTNRDGIDIDCCRNVRVANCVVNSPWDDAICLKSSFALGYARATENVTITNCYVTGMFEYGTLLNGTFVKRTYSEVRKAVGRIKCGTESNGGFRGITVTNCILEGCRGFALETVDGAVIEDIAVSNLSLRDVIHSPIFLRLGTRMRGPADAKPGVLRRVVFSNIVSSGAVAAYPSIVAGTADAVIEDIKFSNLYLEQLGGATTDWRSVQPPENPAGYPEADMFGPLPATGFFLRHARNLEMTDVRIATLHPDNRPAIWAADVDGIDVFRLRTPAGTPQFALQQVRDFRTFGSLSGEDRRMPSVERAAF